MELMHQLSALFIVALLLGLLALIFLPLEIELEDTGEGDDHFPALK